jgi:subtilisin family serine protease
LVHAAGNDFRNTDSSASFPTPYLSNSILSANNFITVGASTDPRIAKGSFVADFSNYGKKSVNVFAPGVRIYSTVQGISNYSNLQGTSMAAPIVSGLSALLRGYFPTLTAAQTKEIIEKSVFKPNEKNSVYVTIGEESKERVTIENGCSSGGIVNAANAVELAFKIDADNKKNSLIKK